jgi:uncharacterized protein (TIGR03435 family)
MDEQSQQAWRNILIIEKRHEPEADQHCTGHPGTDETATADVSRPKFAVTSVKPNMADCCVVGGVGNGGSLNRRATLKMLIGTAYRVQGFQISGGPGWIGSDRFDVEGNAEDPNADFDQLRLMLQSLLEDRFHLQLHREVKEFPIYALVVGKSGPKIKFSADQTSPDVNGPSPPRATGPNHGAFRFGPGSMIGNAVYLSLFAKFLSQRKRYMRRA